MTTEQQPIVKSNASSVTNSDSSQRMQGWFKLRDKIRQSDSPPNQLVRSVTNSKFINNTSTRQKNLFDKPSPSTINTNGHTHLQSEIINPLDSPPNIFASPSIISLASTPRQTTEDTPAIEFEPPPILGSRRESIPVFEIDSITSVAASLSPSSTDSKHSPVPSERMATRKSTKTKETTPTKTPVEISTPITEDISDDDDDMPLIDIRKHKTKSIDTLSTPCLNDSIIPLATDLQSLPGHSLDKTRDTRFLNYSNIETLSLHLTTCLYIDQPSNKQYIFKKRVNVLIKIFKLHYLKTLRKNLSLEKKSIFNKKDHHKQQPLHMISSPTSASFKIDYAANRRNSSSTQRQTPNNFFHILQLNPTKQISSTNSSLSPSTSKSPSQHFERIKDILARAYYPHLYTAIEYGHHFGAKSNFPNTQQLISIHDEIIHIKEMPKSPDINEDSVTITLKSPPSTTRREPIPSSVVPKQNEGISFSSISIESRISEEIDKYPPLIMKKSIVVLTPTKLHLPSPPLIDKEKKSITNRKRKSSITPNPSIKEKKKKRIISSTSSEIVNPIEDSTDSESDEGLVLSQLPKQSFIKNGLRSNYYKKSKDTNSRSTSSRSRLDRRQRQTSGSLPPFYTGIFESDDDKSSHIDYCLPYDIYWLGQQKSKQTSVNNSSSSPPPPPSPLPSSISTFQHKKKKSSKPKQKQPLPYKKILRNVYADQLRQNLLSSYTTEKAPVCDCKSPETCEDGVCLNRMIYTECLPNCACGNKCSNQKIRKNQWFKHLEIFDTGKYGQGLRTTAPIGKGTFLCEYVGEIITDEKFHERMTNIYSKDEHHYTMKLTQNLVIDAYRSGSVARFANHSCLPNCEFQKWTVDGLQRMCMFSLRPIKTGEEITYDYNFQCFNSQAQQPCYCESIKCRGTIGTKQQSTPSPTNNNNINNNNNHHSATMQRLTQREKRIVLQSSIFLLRNLRRVKEKQELRKKNSIKLNKQIIKPSGTPLFFAQNYYHSNPLNNKSTLASLRKTPKLVHKDIFHLFYNHIRHSHFVKTGRYHHELIDNTFYYAQLTQLTLILNEINELILNYKCIDENITPSDVLKKCPSKRVFPAYYEIITKPIDLIMIKTKLNNGDYLSFDLFEQDLILLFKNAIKYCGKDSDEARAVLELQDYFLNTLKIDFKDRLNFFMNMNEKNRNLTNLHTLENFVGRLHDKEVIDGIVRQTLYEIIYNIDDNSENDSPIVYKIVLANNVSSHRTTRSRTSSDCIVHCQCGSVYDENSLVQCYACQLWQHVACVSIGDPSRPYYCFECQPTCECNPSACLKTNVLIPATLSPLQTYDDNYSSYSALTRSDGFLIRINESYFVPKQEKTNIDRSLTSPEYDILFVERLWIDDFGVGQASGYYYIRPNETFHEPSRKFFPNEVFRFPSSNDPLPISSLVRPCFVFDLGTYCRGKPISDNSNRVLSSDLFICDFRVDKTARTFSRLVKSRHFGINTKSYCFDNYVDKLIIKRDYQPYQKEVQQQQHDHRRRSTGNSTKFNSKQREEKHTRINGMIEKIYRRYHDKNLMPNKTKYTVDQLLQASPSSSLLTYENNNHHKNNSHFKRKILSISSPLQSPPGNINKKRRTISVSSDDDIVEYIPENDCPQIPKKRSTKQIFLSPRKHDELID